MWKTLESIISMFVYAAAYMLIVLISIKVVGASLSPGFEKKIGEEGNVGLAIVLASVFIGLAVLLSPVVR
jgi:uncharacterized membrane protein YjfL (UPF0719 family)